MTSSGATAGKSKPVRRRRRILLFLLVLVLVIAGKAGYDYYQGIIQEAALQEAIAEADRLDPGWRLADLEAKRAVIPPERDSAPLVTKAGRAAMAILNTKTVRKDLWSITQELEKLPATTVLTPQQTEELRACLAPLAGPLADARQVADLPEGRYPFNCSPDQLYRLPHVDNASITMWLLRCDALLRAQDGDLDGAWASCQSIFNVARSFGDEPAYVQTTRVCRCADAIRDMERTLAQGQVSAPALAHSQMLLKEEANHPYLLIELRGCRAHLHYLYTQFHNGKFSKAWERRSYQSRSPAFYDNLQDLFGRHEIRPAHARLLHFYTQAVEIAKERGDEAVEALRDLQAKATDVPALACPDINRLLKFLDPKKNRARLDCARAALAVERYRLKHDRWPVTLDDLLPDQLLTEVPADPYDRKPLRYRSTKDGVVIYSVGPNRNAAGAAWDHNVPAADDQRLEFRLWNVEQRRRLP